MSLEAVEQPTQVIELRLWALNLGRTTADFTQQLFSATVDILFPEKLLV